MIPSSALQLARAERRSGRDVAVYAGVFVVLDGRASSRLVDPTVDLARQAEGFAPKRWILPAPE